MAIGTKRKKNEKSHSNIHSPEVLCPSTAISSYCSCKTQLCRTHEKLQGFSVQKVERVQHMNWKRKMNCNGKTISVQHSHSEHCTWMQDDSANPKILERFLEQDKRQFPTIASDLEMKADMSIFTTRYNMKTQGSYYWSDDIKTRNTKSQYYCESWPINDSIRPLRASLSCGGTFIKKMIRLRTAS